MSITNEAAFESAVEAALVERGWKRLPADTYDAAQGLFPAELFAFLRATQPKAMERLAGIHGEFAEQRIMERLEKEIDNRGALDVVREGITERGEKLLLAYFEPANTLNPDLVQLFKENRFGVARQVHFSTNKPSLSIDVVLSVNGLPLATLELKNPFTNQTFRDAEAQYRRDRDPQKVKSLLLDFNRRALVHFAADTSEISCTTRLEGEATHFLPFNKGNGGGKGNAPNPHGYKTAYLWEDILQPRVWMNIVGRLLHVEGAQEHGARGTKARMLFPRYHQVDAVRRLLAAARAHGTGQNYLIQHSAGSGKSNTISWLAHGLASLHTPENTPVFDTVLVITDRRVLDAQLRKNVSQFEQTVGVVTRIEKHSSELATALEKGDKIIITTLQKFPYAMERIAALSKRRYALVIDEAHSSQGGSATKELNAALMQKGTQSGDAAAETDSQTEQEQLEEYLVNLQASIKARGKQSNISIFAFTATPKAKTLEMFGVSEAGQPDDKAKKHPFHLYSMRQAIEEGFILDVLQHYITVDTYLKIVKKIQDDPEIDKRKGMGALVKYVQLHPTAISEKTEMMIEQFRQSTALKLGGKAKAMIVASSRLQALAYYRAFKAYLAEKKYPFGVLVAFSGDLPTHEGSETTVTEVALNGFSEKALPEEFKKDTNRFLIVANKYQTGFDEPLLHTMFLDKQISGVQAVQTLSRVNRTTKGKTDTFIMDFANDEDVIRTSFQPYYEQSVLKQRTDPNHLSDLQQRINDANIIAAADVERFAEIFFTSSGLSSSLKHHATLNAWTDTAAERFKMLPQAPKNQQEQTRKAIESFTRLYPFMMQLYSYGDSAKQEFEKLYVYLRFLLPKLPRVSEEEGESVGVENLVTLEEFRLQTLSEKAVELEKQGENEVRGITEAGLSRRKKEELPLTELIERLNSRFGTTFGAADALFFEQIEEVLLSDEMLRETARANSVEAFSFGFDEVFLDKLFERMTENQSMFDRITSDGDFGKEVKSWFLNKVYHASRSSGVA